jgi:fructosamine-3-kinase
VSGSLPEAVAAALGSSVAAARPVAGGDINQALRLELADGRAVFVKHRRDGNFATEAVGLQWLAAAGALPLPAPLAWDDDWLALEWLDESPRAGDFWERLGGGLAHLHRAGAGAFAGEMLVGDVRLPGEPCPDWPSFYGERRLAPLARMARIDLDRVIERLDELCGPPEPPARLHGDLWSGNVMSGPGGAPWLVDPAAYGGHREIDLAMLQLFGSPPPAFFAAYEEVAPLADGWRERVELHQLLPLLIHAVLFGGGYRASVQRAAARYA